MPKIANPPKINNVNSIREITNSGHFKFKITNNGPTTKIVNVEKPEKLLKLFKKEHKRKKRKKKAQKKKANMVSPQASIGRLIDSMEQQEAKRVIVFLYYEFFKHHKLSESTTTKFLQKYTKLKLNQTMGQLFKSHSITLLKDNNYTLTGKDLWRIYRDLSNAAIKLPELKGASIGQCFTAMIEEKENMMNDVTITMTSTYMKQRHLTHEVLQFLN